LALLALLAPLALFNRANRSDTPQTTTCCVLPRSRHKQASCPAQDRPRRDGKNANSRGLASLAFLAFLASLAFLMGHFATVRRRSRAAIDADSRLTSAARRVSYRVL
jgi:hypothetical protein